MADKMLKVTLVKSTIGAIPKHKATVAALGLKKLNKTVELPDNAWCCARPSGTEPKIKFYMGVKGNSIEDAQAKVEKLTEDLKALL